MSTFYKNAYLNLSLLAYLILRFLKLQIYLDPLEEASRSQQGICEPCDDFKDAKMVCSGFGQVDRKRANFHEGGATSQMGGCTVERHTNAQNLIILKQY